MKKIKRMIMSKIIAPILKKRRMKGLYSYGADMIVGDRCTFIGHVECGNNVYIGEGAYSVSARARLMIQDNVWIGRDSRIMKGVTVGKGSIVALGSIVTKDVSPYTIVAGNPAKVVKQLNKTEESDEKGQC